MIDMGMHIMTILRNFFIAAALLFVSATGASATCATGSGTCFWIPGGGAANWNATTNWSASTGGASCVCTPASGDAIVFDANSGTNGSTANANISIASFTGSASSAVPFTIGAGITITVTTGNFTMSAGMGAFACTGSSSVLNFTATSGTQTLTTGGKAMCSITENGVGGTLAFGDVLVAPQNGGAVITLTNGTLNDNGHAVSFSKFSSNNSNTRVLTRSGAWTSTNLQGGTFWDIGTSTGLTHNDTGSLTWTFNSLSNQGQFNGGGISYNNVTFGSSTSGNWMLMSGANTFANLTLTGALNFQFTSGTTTTVTNAFTWAGTSSNPMYVASNSVVTVATIHASAAGSTIAWAALNGLTFNTNAVNATNSFDLKNNNMNGGSIAAPSGGGGGPVFVIGG